MKLVLLFLVLFAASSWAFLPVPALFSKIKTYKRVSIGPIAPKMVDIIVQVNPGEPIESALRRFKTTVTKSGHLLELKRRAHFETNKEREIRREKEAGRKRRQMKQRVVAGET